MNCSDRNPDDDSYDEVEESVVRRKVYQESEEYYPVDESKPPHY